MSRPPLLCRGSSSPISVCVRKIKHRSEQEDRHERFIRGDALAAEVSLLFPNPALLIGQDSGCVQWRIVLIERSPLSTTSNLLFGNLQQYGFSWVPVQGFAGAGLNSSAGDLLHQGEDGQRPQECVETVSKRFWCYSSEFKNFLSRTAFSQVQFRLAHAMPQPHGQTTHDRNHSDFFLLRISRN